LIDPSWLPSIVQAGCNLRSSHLNAAHGAMAAGPEVGPSCSSSLGEGAIVRKIELKEWEPPLRMDNMPRRADTIAFDVGDKLLVAKPLTMDVAPDSRFPCDAAGEQLFCTFSGLRKANEPATRYPARSAGSHKSGKQRASAQRSASDMTGVGRELPSLGSEGHANGTCKPCAHNWKAGACYKGKDCPFCHLCKADDYRRFRKSKAKRLRQEKVLRLRSATSSSSGARSDAPSLPALFDTQVLEVKNTFVHLPSDDAPAMRRSASSPARLAGCH